MSCVRLAEQALAHVRTYQPSSIMRPPTLSTDKTVQTTSHCTVSYHALLFLNPILVFPLLPCTHISTVFSRHIAHALHRQNISWNIPLRTLLPRPPAHHSPPMHHSTHRILLPTPSTQSTAVDESTHSFPYVHIIHVLLHRSSH